MGQSCKAISANAYVIIKPTRIMRVRFILCTFSYVVCTWNCTHLLTSCEIHHPFCWNGCHTGVERRTESSLNPRNSLKENYSALYLFVFFILIILIIIIITIIVTTTTTTIIGLILFNITLNTLTDSYGPLTQFDLKLTTCQTNRIYHHCEV